MTDPDIQFGEIEEAPPQRRRRPDRDRHFAVADCGTPSDGDLPIFVDMDVLADAEDHAQTDTSVELGGVLLGGQYLDDDGRPFVVVSDSLRAAHYESSRGHFKFTHDTWSQISRQRDEFSDDLQMVGWYHTHPDWGVFLSTMDRFICDHFFNRPLDVALVIDPVRNDRGWFSWKQDGGEPLPRTGRFTVTASRFRRRELAAYVAQLEGKIPMTPDYRLGQTPGMAPGVSSQVIHTIRPQMGWMGIAILAMLVLQACLTLIVALRLDGSGRAGGAPREAGQSASAEPQEAFQQLAIVEERLHREFDRLSQADFLLSELTDDYKALKEQHTESVARLARAEESNAELVSQRDDLREQLRQVTEERDEALAQAEAAKAEIDRPESSAPEAEGDKTTQPGKKPDEAAKEPASGDEEPEGVPLWVILLIAALILLAGAAIVIVLIQRKRRPRHPESEGEPEHSQR